MNYRNLTKNDVIVIHGGSNDVYRNNSKVALLQIVKFIQDVNNTNIVVLDIPHRYDLGKNSYVNKEIQYFNQKRRKITKLFKHVSVLEVSSNREAFTQHGLHLNIL
jgi:GTPase SAR1 family protein